MLKKLEKIFGSKTKAQEILFLLEDAKEVVRQGFYPEELEGVEKFCQENRLILTRSKFKVFLDDKDTYSNKGIRVDGSSEGGMYFVYISKSEKKSLLASYYELVGNDYELGLLLGYPKCCVNFFKNSFNENKTNLELEPTTFWTNISKRKEDCVLLSHFPCHSDCTNSLKLAKKYFKVLKYFDEKRAEELFRRLTER